MDRAKEGVAGAEEMDERGKPQDLPTPDGVTLHFKGCHPGENIEFLNTSFKAKKPIVWGGLSILGETGYFTRVVGISRRRVLVESGWGYIDGGPPELAKGLFRFGFRNLVRSSLVQNPNWMIYVVGEVDPLITWRLAPKERIDKVVQWALSHIHD